MSYRFDELQAVIRDKNVRIKDVKLLKLNLICLGFFGVLVGNLLWTSLKATKGKIWLPHWRLNHNFRSPKRKCWLH